ncbi:MAG: hypothetical protein AAF405_02120 [Pseudomonadota bacterium]
MAAVLCLGPPKTAAAQDSLSYGTYITPFPNGDRYRVVVLGDAMGEGLWSGLYRSFEEDPSVDVLQQSKKWTGFTDPKRYDWTAQVDPILSKGNYHVAVVMFGLGENKAIRKDGKLLQVGTDEWREAYGERVEAFIRKLRDRGLGVYWVGLPIMRSASQRAAAERLNDIFREKTFVNGAKFIDTWKDFSDENGQYTLVGLDASGRRQTMRSGDNLTSRGNLKLAGIVNKELRKDIDLAKKERDIPLAGNPDEQAKVALGLAPAPSSSSSGSGGSSGSGEDALRKDQVGDVSVFRPEGEATAPLADASAAAAEASPDPQGITSELPGGYTAISSISPVSDVTLSSSRPQLPLAQRPYYRVLVRGQQLEPKSGRADDFAWPPS